MQIAIIRIHVYLIGFGTTAPRLLDRTATLVKVKQGEKNSSNFSECSKRFRGSLISAVLSKGTAQAGKQILTRAQLCYFCHYCNSFIFTPSEWD